MPKIAYKKKNYMHVHTLQNQRKVNQVMESHHQKQS